MSYNDYYSSSIDTFLEGGEILALLIQAGADLLAADDLGQLPQDMSYMSTSFPLPSVEKQILLAFWHQALRICDLLESKYCHCPAHHRKKKRARRDVGFGFLSRRPGLFYDTFEEEMSAALRGWDKFIARKIPSSSANGKTYQNQEEWDRRCDRYDEWIQKVLIELQARQKKASSERHVNASPSVGEPSRRMEEDELESDEMESSDELSMIKSVPLTYESDSDEDWETSSSSSSNNEEEWESAPEN